MGMGVEFSMRRGGLAEENIKKSLGLRCGNTGGSLSETAAERTGRSEWGSIRRKAERDEL